MHKKWRNFVSAGLPREEHLKLSLREEGDAGQKLCLHKERANFREKKQWNNSFKAQSAKIHTRTISLNMSISIKEIKSILNLPKQEAVGPEGLTDKFCQILRKKLHQLSVFLSDRKQKEYSLTHSMRLAIPYN